MTPKKEAIRLTKLWQDYGPNTYPLDVDRLIEGALQTSGYNGSLHTVRRPLDSIEGCLVRQKDTNDWLILLNDNIENARRLRFTHAHELGHFMCHRDKQDMFEDSVDSLNDFNREIELEANTFASWLLMPANIVRSEFGSADWGVKTLRDLGNRFECSLQASALRFVSISERPIAFVVSRDGMILWAKSSSKAPFMEAYRFGDELPEYSEAKRQLRDGHRSSDRVETDFAWSENKRAEETQYFDQSGLGYQYTCIEFEC